MRRKAVIATKCGRRRALLCGIVSSDCKQDEDREGAQARLWGRKDVRDDVVRKQRKKKAQKKKRMAAPGGSWKGSLLASAVQVVQVVQVAQA